MQSLFCYGTLMYRPLLQMLIGAEVVAWEAQLKDYACYGVNGVTYPAIVPEPDAETAGLLVENIRPGAWFRLDRYEGEYYRRENLSVVLADGTRREAKGYVMRPRYRPRLSRRLWHYGAEAERYAKAQLVSLAGGQL